MIINCNIKCQVIRGRSNALWNKCCHLTLHAIFNENKVFGLKEGFHCQLRNSVGIIKNLNPIKVPHVIQSETLGIIWPRLVVNPRTRLLNASSIASIVAVGHSTPTYAAAYLKLLQTAFFYVKFSAFFHDWVV